MWWRSFSIADEVTSSRTTMEQIAKGYSQINLRKLTLASAGGRIVVRWERYWMPVANATVIELQHTTDRFWPHDWDLEHRNWPNRVSKLPRGMLNPRLGFSWYREEQLRPKDPLRWSFVFPHWLAVGVFALAPAVLVVKMIRRRQRSGTCAVCGYDMRATPERCPECGAVADVSRTMSSNAPLPSPGGRGD
jgi:hypothetical protein